MLLMTTDAFCIQRIARISRACVRHGRNCKEEDPQTDIFAFEADALKVVIGNFVRDLKTDNEGLNRR